MADALSELDSRPGAVSVASAASPSRARPPAPTRHAQKTRVQIWLFDQPLVRLEGVVLGFDEYMNIVIDQCVEATTAKSRGGDAGGKVTRTPLGQVLLKGDNVTAMLAAPA